MLAYVGSYTTAARRGRGRGITVYRIDPGTGAWTQQQLVEDLPNPSWLVLDARGRTLYAAHGDGEAVSAYAVEPRSGRLRPLGHQPAGGVNGVRLGIDGSGRFLVCANYSSGSVAVLPILADGALGGLTDL